MDKDQLMEMYKECFERFIPDRDKDEANLFLSTYGSELAKVIAQGVKKQRRNEK